MNKQMQRRHAARVEGSEGGFTLIELLIVIVILGVLAAVVVFAVGGITKTGDKAACQADLASVQTAVEAFRANTGAYPAGANALASLVPNYLGNNSGISGNTKTNGATYTITYDPATHAVTASDANCSTLAD